MSESLLARLLRDLPDADSSARSAVALRASKVLRPSGAFERLDTVAGWLASWQGRPDPVVERAHVLVFAADHGVAAEGVSAYPQAVTRSMLDAMRAGHATVAVLAKSVGAGCEVFDVGVGKPTANLVYEDAMSPSEFDAAVQVGVNAVSALQTDLLVLGEVGIGNTTSAAAVSAGVLGGPPGDWVGPGSGVCGVALERKREIVRRALNRVGPANPLDMLRRLGGKELAAMAGATLAARHRGIPMLLDGFIATAAVAPLQVTAPGSLEHVQAGHSSAEPGHVRQLDALGLKPLLSLGLRLGEGSGAVLAIPIVRAACAAIVNVATFEEAGLG